jgi:hypothetical protein
MIAFGELKIDELKIENVPPREQIERLIVILKVFSCLKPRSELIHPFKRVWNLAQS